MKLKKNHIILLSIEVLLLLFLVINIFITKIFTNTNMNYILLWGISLIFLMLTVGLEKEKKVYKTDVMQLIVIYVITYFMIIYIFGLFVGFIKSPYSITVIDILKNITPVLLIIIFQELIRYIVISKSKEKKLVIVVMTTVFIAFDILLLLPHYNLNEIMNVFEFVVLVSIPSIINNLLFTYISYKSGYKTTIVYRLLMEVSLFILPIYPELGLYIKSVIAIVFPLIVFLGINSFFARNTINVTKKKRILMFLFWGPVSMGLICMVVLISGFFKVQGIAVGSGSMSPQINKGDAVLVEKLTNDEIHFLDIGHVIAYEKEGILVIHRIVDMYYKEGKLVYQTKGDNNENNDNYIVEINELKGIVRFRFPYIGYPSVWINELIKK